MHGAVASVVRIGFRRSAPLEGWFLFWKEEVSLIEDVVHAHRALAIKSCRVNDGFQWVVVNVYGPNVEVERSEFLDLLANFNLDGMFRGSLEEILIWLDIRMRKKEKIGSINVNDLVDLPLQRRR